MYHSVLAVVGLVNSGAKNGVSRWELQLLHLPQLHAPLIISKRPCDRKSFGSGIDSSHRIDRVCWLCHFV